MFRVDVFRVVRVSKCVSPASGRQPSSASLPSSARQPPIAKTGFKFSACTSCSAFRVLVERSLLSVWSAMFRVFRVHVVCISSFCQFSSPCLLRVTKGDSSVFCFCCLFSVILGFCDSCLPDPLSVLVLSLSFRWWCSKTTLHFWWWCSPVWV